ncbi:LysM peptidoglycan-binding domain-containing protein [Nannocystaceae bacterium ST9]
MLDARSRYRNCGPFVGDTNFRGTRAREIGPAEGVIEHVVEQGERLDLLALRYYNDVHLWWRILDANPELLSASELLEAQWVGQVIVVPRAEESGS